MKIWILLELTSDSFSFYFDLFFFLFLFFFFLRLAVRDSTRLEEVDSAGALVLSQQGLLVLDSSISCSYPRVAQALLS